MKYKPRKGEYKYIIKKAKKGAGLGLFAEEDIKKGKFIIEYYGPEYDIENDNGYGGKYLFAINSKKYIDGAPRYNTARYVNHSCRPNSETKIQKGKIYIYSKKNIKAGEEIAYDYGKEYFNDFIKPIGCQCVKCGSK